MLTGLPEYFSDGRQRVWRIDANDAFKRRICDETPTGRLARKVSTAMATRMAAQQQVEGRRVARSSQT